MPKESFRKQALQRLRCRIGVRGYRQDKQAVEVLKRYLSRQNIRSVLLYIPLPIEVDVRPLIVWLRRRGVTVYVPFMEGESFRLVKYRLPLRRKRFGIYEPKHSKQHREKKIDIAIVPVVGIDSTGRRIGFGKGMYDRFFDRERRNIQQIVFVQKELCRSPIPVTDDYDIKGDILVTGNGKIVKLS